ncbi:hypothetical protein NDU88_001712 [Pleurodeles waltl]|uniref:Uncharacterized protein n=1 Tax=Pleurodeles waltl TaxID=8319 RepID=A0AAV7SCZ3_PLEWA|nr:hypothetical protein NDU88_001712 [Pleurodeles waltl]
MQAPPKRLGGGSGFCPCMNLRWSGVRRSPRRLCPWFGWCDQAGGFIYVRQCSVRVPFSAPEHRSHMCSFIGCCPRPMTIMFIV